MDSLAVRSWVATGTALGEYINTLHRYIDEQRNSKDGGDYSSIEIAKIHLADAFLDMLGVPTSPPSEDRPIRRGKQ